MRIYIAHSREFDFKNELYAPIRNNEDLKGHDIILPHEISDVSSNTRDFYKDIDLIIAECSYPSTGLGIELGWAFDDNRPLYCIHKQGTKVSGSIYEISQNIFEYKNIEEMLKIIENIVMKNDENEVAQDTKNFKKIK